MRILLDTDIGDDIDDALALALALQLPSIDLVGVTTVFRDTAARARMARHLLDRFDYRNVPIYAGAGRPLGRHVVGDPALEHAAAQLALTPAEVTNAGVAHAVDLIRNTFVEPGSDVVLVTIGPLTNLALALALDPGLARRIPRVVAMGGQIGRAAGEWNIRCDPEAAAMVLGAGLPLTLVPLDVTTKTRMQARHLRALEEASAPAVQWLATLTDAWQSEGNQLPVLHDPLALAVAQDSAWVDLQTLRLDVVTAPGPGRGITCVVSGDVPPVQVALGVDGDRFVDWFTEQILRG